MLCKKDTPWSDSESLNRQRVWYVGNTCGNNAIQGVLRGAFTALNTYICNHEKMTFSEKLKGGSVYNLTVTGEW